MKFIFFIFFMLVCLVDANEAVIVEDTSGMTNDEVRAQAKQNDITNDAMLDGDFDDFANEEKTWQNLSPTPKNYDWIQTKSGEWFKGYIKSMFNKSLEFDSEEIGMRKFDFKDVVQIKSYQIISINIDGIAIIEGIVRLKNDKITIVQGNNKFEFFKDEIVSFADSGKSEKDKWCGKISISMDSRNGNTKQLDYSAQGTFKRRTAKTSLIVSYLGRYSKVQGVLSADDHRLNEKFDIYFTKDFFWTPIFSEYYQDKFKNISTQITAGTGIGYMLISTDKIEWDITAGPALLSTNYISVSTQEKEKVSSFSAEFSTMYTDKLTQDIDFTYSYKFSLTGDLSGRYKHHMLAKLENELTDWIDLDLTYIWDYIDKPTKNSEGIVFKKDDFQLLVGLGIEY